MMPDTVGTTAHQQRSVQVRERCQRVLARIPSLYPHNKLPKRQGGFTVYGIFMERAAKIADEHGIVLSKQKDKTTTGIHKDAASSFRRFMEAKTIGWEKHMDVYELTCLSFEQSFREKRQEARERLSVVRSTPDEPEAVTAHEEAEHEPPVVHPLGTREALDAEIEAIRVFNEALEPLHPRARARVLQWAADKYAEEGGL